MAKMETWTEIEQRLESEKQLLKNKVADLEDEIKRLKRKIDKMQKQLDLSPEEKAKLERKQKRKEFISEYWWVILPITGLLMVALAYILRVVCGFNWWE